MLMTMKLAKGHLRTAIHGAALISVRSFGISQLPRKCTISTREQLNSSPSLLIQTSKHPSRSSHYTTSTQLDASKVDGGEDAVSTSEEQEFASSYHAPVMYKECIDALLKRSHNHTKKRNKYKKEKEPAEVQSHLDHNRPRIFIDGTLGGGGHSSCLLQSLSPGDILIGCDVDPSALATASTRLKDYLVPARSDSHDSKDKGEDKHDKPIFIPVQSNFRDLAVTLKDMSNPISGEPLLNSNDDNIGVDGILLDLGISSHQIDNAERGFAFMKDGPLDMRLWGGQWENQANEFQSQKVTDYNFVENKNDSHGGMNAADICNEFAEEEISRILKVYGDEPRARKIAQSIVNYRPLSTTGDLKDAVAAVTPEFARKGRRMGRTATLARVFQALRIVVNEEDDVLRDALEHMAPSLVRKGGRLVVLSYHSMEDRATKRVLRDGSVMGSRRGGGGIEKDIFGNEILSAEGVNARPWKTLGKKQKATAEEVEVNPRARSATLRVGEKL